MSAFSPKDYQIRVLDIVVLAVGRPARIEDTSSGKRRLAMTERMLQAGRAGLVVTAVKHQGNHENATPQFGAT